MSVKIVNFRKQLVVGGLLGLSLLSRPVVAWWKVEDVGGCTSVGQTTCGGDFKTRFQCSQMGGGNLFKLNILETCGQDQICWPLSERPSTNTETSCKKGYAPIGFGAHAADEGWRCPTDANAVTCDAKHPDGKSMYKWPCRQTTDPAAGPAGWFWESPTPCINCRMDGNTAKCDSEKWDDLLS